MRETVRKIVQNVPKMEGPEMDEETRTIVEEIRRIIWRNITDTELLRKIWSMAAMQEEIRRKNKR